MKRLRKTDYVIIAVVLALMAFIAFMVVRGSKTENKQGSDVKPVAAASTPKELTVKDYAGKRIGVQTGTVFDEMIKENIPDAEISYYNSYTDLLSALKADKIDGFAADEPLVKYMMIEDDSVDYLKDKMDDYSFGFAFSKDDKGEALCNEFSEYVKRIKTDGTLAEIDAVWFGTDESKKIIPALDTLSGGNGKLSLATEAANAPFVYIANDDIVGYEIDVAYRFCKEYGYALEIVDMNFDGIIPAVSGGKNDFGCATITITEERRESVNFSEPHYDGGSVLAVRASDLEGTADTAAPAQPTEPSYTEFNGKRIGIKTGSAFEAITLETFPYSEFFYYETESDLLQALRANKIDAFLDDEPVAAMMHAEQPDVNYLKNVIVDDDYYFGFTKGGERTEKLRGEFNEYIAELKANGELDEMKAKWTGSDESAKTFDDSVLTGKNGELNVAVIADVPPFSYTANNKLQGYAIELMNGFARKYGYSIHYEQSTATGCLTGVATGKYDILASDLSYTEERAESIEYSDVIYNGGVVLVARSAEVEVKAAPEEPEEPSYTEFNGKRIGIKTGSSFESITLENFPDSEFYYYETESDLVQALGANKIDAFLDDEPVAAMLHAERPNFDYLKKVIVDDDYYFGFKKGTERSEKVRAEFNEYLAGLKANGELDELKAKWIAGDESSKTLDDSGLTGENGELKVTVIADGPPFSYTSNNKLQGYAIELMTMFARKYGYSIHYEQSTVTGCLTGLSAGKYDIFAANLSYTEERAESIDFSDMIYKGGVVLVARSADLEVNTADTAQSVEDRSLGYYAANGKIGAITGGLYEVIIRERYPDAEILQYNSQPDLAIALSEGKIDAFTCPKSAAEDFMAADSSLTYLKEIFMEIPYGFAFKKTDGENVLRDQMNEYLAKIRADGTYDEIVDTWFGSDESKKTVDFTGLDGKETTLRYITASTMQPYSYIKDGQNAGLEVDLVARFCKEYGYGLRIDNADFAGLVPGVAGGTYDIASGNIMITEERAESVDFSDVYYTGQAVSVVRKESTASDENTPAAESKKGGFIESIKESFNKNFIREDRYKLILEGVGMTCMITVLSVIFGSILAFLICLFRRADSVLSGKICDMYVKLLQGTPMVVLLMILYYVIFGKSGIAAMWVAVIGFSLNFGAYVSEILRSGIDSIDGGQREAALALGYSENQAFFRFIFPQAAVRQLGVYRGEIISLLKNTSIVGYIAIQDLTKMSDIIRSRTYEAFFPLIVTAVIYFLLAWIISLILKFILKQIDPRSRKRGVKGVAVK